LGKNRFIMVVSTKANQAKEAEYNKWYDEHIVLLFGFKDLKRVSRSRCSRPLGPTGVNSPLYMTLYEFESKETLEAFQKSPRSQAAKDLEERFSGLGEILWSGWYESEKTLERSSHATKNRFLEVAASGPKPGKNVEYHEYYEDHFTNMFEYEGVKKVSYSRCIRPLEERNGKCPPYLTVYEFENKEDLDAFYLSPIFIDAGKDWEEIGQGAMELYFAACYEPLKTLER
jgi:hypothetical protein